MKCLSLSLLLTGLLMTGPVLAGEKSETKAGSDELEHARQELAAARDELRRASEEFARASEELGQKSTRAYAYRYMTDEDRAVLGVVIAPGPEKDGQIRGVRVTSVTPGSGAEKAGVRSGDLLLSANGVSLASQAEHEPGPEHRLMELMASLKPAAEVKLEYERAGKKAGCTVVAQRAADTFAGMDWNDDEDGDMLVPVPPVPPIPPLPPLPPMPPHAAMASLLALRPGLGLQLVPLNEDLASYFDTPDGVLVVHAPKDSSLKLKGGDVIQRIDGRTVAGPQDVLEQLADAAPGTPVKFNLVRRGKSQTLEASAPQAQELYGPMPWPQHTERPAPVPPVPPKSR